jgi:lipoprotein-anchoring transpeptidase ErfK/SrfK
MLDNLGEFLTRSTKENKFQNAVFPTPDSFSYYSRLGTLAEIIPYYEGKLNRELAMTWGMKGLAREQIVTVSSAVREPGTGEIIDSSSVVIDEMQEEEDDE